MNNALRAVRRQPLLWCTIIGALCLYAFTMVRRTDLIREESAAVNEPVHDTHDEHAPPVAAKDDPHPSLIEDKDALTSPSPAEKKPPEHKSEKKPREDNKAKPEKKPAPSKQSSEKDNDAKKAEKDKNPHKKKEDDDKKKEPSKEKAPLKTDAAAKGEVVERTPFEDLPSCASSEAYIGYSQAVGRWLEDVAIHNDDGPIMWQVVPELLAYKPNAAGRPPGWLNGGYVDKSLYAGVAGVVVFFVDLYAHTNDPTHRILAERGADYLHFWLNTTSLSKHSASLYVGGAGVAFALQEVHRVTMKEKYFDGALYLTRHMLETAVETEHGVDWGQGFDIVFGSAGTGLYLLYAYEQEIYEDALAVAIKVGDHLIAEAVPAPPPRLEGLKWIDKESNFGMPGFSHGTAGVAYFLARLYEVTGEIRFLDAAVAGAHYLLASTRDDGLTPHHEIDNEGSSFAYLGWCHGPVGVARLYYQLYKVTKKAEWLDEVRDGALAIMATPIPNKKHEGYWENYGVCCGAAGIAGFTATLGRELNNDTFVRYACKLAEHAVKAATRTSLRLRPRSLEIGEVEDEEVDVEVDVDEKGNTTFPHGLAWKHAENRADPKDRAAQTGFMQGAAGVGAMLLRMGRQLAEASGDGGGGHEGRPVRTVRWPDSPFDS